MACNQGQDFPTVVTNVTMLSDHQSPVHILWSKSLLLPFMAAYAAYTSAKTVRIAHAAACQVIGTEKHFRAVSLSQPDIAARKSGCVITQNQRVLGQIHDAICGSGWRGTSRSTVERALTIHRPRKAMGCLLYVADCPAADNKELHLAGGLLFGRLYCTVCHPAVEQSSS